MINPKKIIEQADIFPQDDELVITTFKSIEDGAEYDVWLVESHDKRAVLKKAKGREIEIYSSFFAQKTAGAPEFMGSVNVDGDNYFLMEYVEGRDICWCERDMLKRALDALISLQEKYWDDTTRAEVGLTFEESLKGRRERGRYINDPEIEAAYSEYLSLYCELPRTLCHDDLLPFNILADESGAAIIDWECAGILPYPTSIARMLAHAEEREGALFYMRDEDKKIAIDYYYEQFISHKGIAKPDYIRAINLFLLYEYCEWIMLGNKYADADMERYHVYFHKARGHLGKCNF